MGREIRVVWAGRHQRSTWEDLCSDYRKRVARFVPITDQPVRSRSSADGAARRKAEGRELLAALPDPCWTFALDNRGRAVTSTKFAAQLGRLRQEWPHPIAFVIGSDLGLDDCVLDESRQVLAFGPMTFTHELARLILYEQIYRALAIEAGINYHR